ncbi:MAG: small multi-drug export protein [Actinomycetota bacterium]|nr:small multi-drug export protein [Actinomycetota bacterium]
MRITDALTLEMIKAAGWVFSTDTTRYADWFSGIPTFLRTIVIAMLPIVELRGAIPAAVLGWDMSYWSAYLWAVIGNMIPIFFILWLLEPVSRWLMRHSKLMDRFFTWLFARTRKKVSHSYERWQDLALLLFVAVPLPITGAWTGSVAAFVFGIPYRRALPLIFGGVLVAGGIVTAVTALGETIGLTAFLISSTVLAVALITLYVSYRRGMADSDLPA